MRGARFLITRGEFFMIKEMYERGMSISDIARELGIDRKTVRKYIHSPNPPSKSKRKQRKSKLDPFKEYLQKRMLEDGVFNSEKLFFEIRQQGYTVKSDDKIPNIAGIKFPAYNTMRGAMVRDYKRGNF